LKTNHLASGGLPISNQSSHGVWPVVSHFSLNGLNKGQMDDQFMRLVNQLKKEPFLLKYQNTFS
jgi:hypothetical protein